MAPQRRGKKVVVVASRPPLAEDIHERALAVGAITETSGASGHALRSSYNRFVVADWKSSGLLTLSRGSRRVVPTRWVRERTRIDVQGALSTRTRRRNDGSGRARRCNGSGRNRDDLRKSGRRRREVAIVVVVVVVVIRVGGRRRWRGREEVEHSRRGERVYSRENILFKNHVSADNGTPFCFVTEDPSFRTRLVPHEDQGPRTRIEFRSCVVGSLDPGTTAKDAEVGDVRR